MPSKPLIAPELQTHSVAINELNLWPNNPRRGDVGALSESLKRFGQVRPILVQKSTMRIVAGNHIYRAASALGWTEIAAVVTEMDDKQAKAYVAADNRAAELGDFDEELLAKLLKDIAQNDTLEGTGYDNDDLDELLAKVGSVNKTGFGNPDGTKAPPEEPWVQPGQLFKIGDHRIICAEGDDTGAIGRLLDGALPDALVMHKEGEDQPYADLLGSFDKVPEQFWFGPWGTDLVEQIVNQGSWLVWDKQNENTAQEHAPGFELVWSKTAHRPEVFRHIFVGAADGESHGGPDFNERPTSLYQDIFERYVRYQGLILDPYAVGATALVAADRSGKVYYGAKSNPAYVQSLLEKWVEWSGIDYEEIAE